MTMFRSNKQLPMKLLIMYMISALLFLTFTDLHIHTKKAATTADHGSAVSISSLSDELTPSGTSDEIKVNPDGALKINQDSLNILAVFLLVTLLTILLFFTLIHRCCESDSLAYDLPFYGTPPLRAPPQ